MARRQSSPSSTPRNDSSRPRCAPSSPSPKISGSGKSSEAKSPRAFFQELFIEAVDEPAFIDLLDDRRVRDVFEFQARRLGNLLPYFGNDGLQAIAIRIRLFENLEARKIFISSFGLLSCLQAQLCLQKLRDGDAVSGVQNISICLEQRFHDSLDRVLLGFEVFF